jgi:hypothetical protein
MSLEKVLFRRVLLKFRARGSLLCLVLIVASGCQQARSPAQSGLTITKIPPAGDPNPVRMFAIDGKISKPAPGEKIVLFAHAATWSVQPKSSQPFTEIAPDGHWVGATHAGTEYAALLVKSDYQVVPKLVALPVEGGNVVAVINVKGLPTAPPIRKIHFSGYDWEVCDYPNDRGGTLNVWAPENVWVDSQGLLHLRLSRDGTQWKSAAVRMLRSLGYGSYRFVVQDTSHLEPAAVLTLLTWNGGSTEHEMDVEVSRWGQPASKNAQYVVQPYYVAANVLRFTAPSGVLTHSFSWQPGRVTFRTERGSTNSSISSLVGEHTFTVGVPTPDNDFVRINLYRFGNKTSPLINGADVIVEKFEYLP